MKRVPFATLSKLKCRNGLLVKLSVTALLALVKLLILKNTKQLFKDMFRHDSCHRQFIENLICRAIYTPKLQIQK